MQGVVFVAVCVIGQIYAATTVKPHHHAHESNELDPTLFYYDAASNYLVMKLADNCYLEKFSTHHGINVHTEEGLLAAETRLMFLVSKGTKHPMSHDQVNHLSQHVEHMCAGASVYTVSGAHHHHTTTMAPMI
ncbi:uncharacterized protein LOC132543683 [Ylistrum balloti]|uniref:uncharacterized protein LOC132543683 n=1 Tax=Ylistrum balloti TaxID=509963 RepID=UPI002905E385|nr:uncharacterized protein LOC132543683 [Ylistrum balloti]